MREPGSRATREPRSRATRELRSYKRAWEQGYGEPEAICQLHQLDIPGRHTLPH